MNKKQICKIASAAMAGVLLVSGSAFVGLQQSGWTGANNGGIFGSQKLTWTASPEKAYKTVVADQMSTQQKKEKEVTIHYKWEGSQPHLYYNVEGQDTFMTYPGVPMNKEGNGWYSYTITEAEAATMQINVPEKDYSTSQFDRQAGEYWFSEESGWKTEAPEIGRAHV